MGKQQIQEQRIQQQKGTTKMAQSIQKDKSKNISNDKSKNIVNVKQNMNNSKPNMKLSQPNINNNKSSINNNKVINSNKQNVNKPDVSAKKVKESIPNKNVASNINTEKDKKSIDDLFTKLKQSQKDQKIKVEKEKLMIEKLREDIILNTQIFIQKAKKKIKQEETKYKTDENGVKYTEEGYRIYTVEELKIGKGGDTKDCPFDCNCCF